MKGYIHHKNLVGDDLHQPFEIGNDEDKSNSPTSGDWYFAVDTNKLYRCAIDGVWETREINDSGLGVTDLWSAQKIESEIATISGAGGTSNHSELNELDYASAGHTGFASEALLTTTSGDLQTNIDSKDNYSSWSFAVDSVTKDPITSGDILDFAGGNNVTITRSADDQITISADVITNLDGGVANSVYGPIAAIDGGDAALF